jgi:hypothetical protein
LDWENLVTGRQDPSFPDTIFESELPKPGIEIKSWFPLAAEYEV